MVREDLKQLIKTKMPTPYVRFKENKITDQNNTSSNCGEFAVHFLLARLNGESFGRASGWNALGESRIEQWKKHEGKRLWCDSFRGSGLRDIFDKVRRGATNIVKRIKDTLSGPRNMGSPAVRGWLEKYGNEPILDIQVCKKLIYSMIETIGNWLSMGKLRENIDKQSYERFMHLWVIIKIPSGSYKLEKNEIIQIKASDD